VCTRPEWPHLLEHAENRHRVDEGRGSLLRRHAVGLDLHVSGLAHGHLREGAALEEDDLTEEVLDVLACILHDACALVAKALPVALRVKVEVLGQRDGDALRSVVAPRLGLV